MPLLEDTRQVRPQPQGALLRRESAKFSKLAKSAMLSGSNAVNPANASINPAPEKKLPLSPIVQSNDTLAPPPRTSLGRAVEKPVLQKHVTTKTDPNGQLGHTLSDTPLPSAPGSPLIPAKQRENSIATIAGVATPRSPRLRATTLDIPGLTRSKVSPDGRISGRDVGSKLIILMVGLPARGKSYIVKKIARYLNWLQHPTRIFNVGDRRRVAAGTGSTITTVESKLRESVRKMSLSQQPHMFVDHQDDLLGPPAVPATIMVNDQPRPPSPAPDANSNNNNNNHNIYLQLPAPVQIEQDSKFFDPDNQEARRLREQVAHETLDELLKYVLEDGGSVGILDATNHTIERRMSLIRHIRERDATVNVMFLESRCQDRNLLEANMRLKLSGPDYKDKDPVKALMDFQERVLQYEKKYQNLGDFEENNNLPYCSMIDVGRKMVSHKISGFLSIQAVTYLMNFNLAPRQIWLTRHGESEDNVNGKIGGDSSLSPLGKQFGNDLERFIDHQRAAWDQLQIHKQSTTHFPPLPGDTTPPNPEHSDMSGESRNFCVWTSMLKRSVESAQAFNEEDYDVKQMRMLDELYAGSMEGMTYQQIRNTFKAEYELRKRDKLHYRYPGPGGEGYLDVINRLRKVILEIERMTDHVLIIGHRSITRVLLAYFLGLKQEDISDLDVPLGVVYMLEPRPYGVDFKAYRWHPESHEFTWEENYRLKRAVEPAA